MPTTDNLARRVVDRYKSRSSEVAHAMAQQIGQPLDGQEPSREERVRLWNFQAAGVDPQMVAMALQSGQIQPSQAVDALYPYRSKLIGSGTPRERVERAERLAGDAAKWQAEQMANLPPAPPSAPPLPVASMDPGAAAQSAPVQPQPQPMAPPAMQPPAQMPAQPQEAM